MIDLEALTTDQKLELIDELWQSVDADDLRMTPEQRAELDRRIERVERDGPVGPSWDSVLSEMSRG